MFAAYACVYVWVCICVGAYTRVYMQVETCQRSMWHVSAITCHIIFLFMCICGGMQMTSVVPDPEEGPGVTGSCEPFDVDAGN